MQTFCVYRLVFPDGGNYIGITSDIKRRWRGDGIEYKQKRVKEAIRFHGWENIKHEILYSDLTKEQAQELEKVCIQKYDSIEHGYNVSKGGEMYFYGMRQSESAKDRISQKMKAHIKTHEHCKHISEKKTGVLHHAAKKVFQYTKTGQFLREWLYMNEASKTLSISKASISQCCLGIRPSAGGYVWRYERGD